MRIFYALFLGLFFAQTAKADSELSLYNEQGSAVAYIAINEDSTIYLWEGKPVAYLTQKTTNEYHVYGFNGKHLGWFVGGNLYDHDGNASCALKENMRSTSYESYKSYKEYKPYKSYKEYPPYRPYLNKSFGDSRCELLLSFGAN